VPCRVRRLLTRKHTAPAARLKGVAGARIARKCERCGPRCAFWRQKSQPQEFELRAVRRHAAARLTHAPPQPQRSAALLFDLVSRAGNKSSSCRRTPYSARAQINSPRPRHRHHALDAPRRRQTMSSPALAENTNAAPAAAEPVIAAKKAKTSVEGKASPTKVVEAPAEEPKRKESGEGAVAEKPAEPAAEPAKEVPVPRRQRFSSMAWRFRCRSG